MGHLVILLAIGWCAGKVCTAGWRLITVGLRAFSMQQPYRVLHQSELTRLQDCEATLAVMIGEIDAQRPQISDAPKPRAV